MKMGSKSKEKLLSQCCSNIFVGRLNTFLHSIAIFSEFKISLLVLATSPLQWNNK